MAAKRTTKADDGAETVLHERIREAAYLRWRSRGMPQGTELDDWLAAEAELAPTPKPVRRAPVRKKASPV